MTEPAENFVMTDLARFLSGVRKKRGHRTVVELAHFARTIGEHITSEALRKFERTRTPSRESRAVLSRILQMTASEVQRMESLCLAADTKLREEESVVKLDAYVMDNVTRPPALNRLMGAVDALLELDESERDELRAQFERVLRGT